MEETKRYTIAYRGLRSGLHDFHFKVDGGLFRAFGSTEIKDGDCDVSVALERGESMLTLDVTVDGSVVVECDRCLEDCNVPIHYEGQLLVKFSDEVHEYDGEVMWLLPMEDEVDLTQYIYESIVLALPYQRVHPDGECNPDMLERFPHRFRRGVRPSRRQDRGRGPQRGRMGQAGRAQGTDGGRRDANRTKGISYFRPGGAFVPGPGNI